MTDSTPPQTDDACCHGDPERAREQAVGRDERTAQEPIDPVNQKPVVHFRKGREEGRSETRGLIGESPLVVEIGESNAYTLMRTPGQDRELAMGFLLSEGLIESRADVEELSECPFKDDVVLVKLARRSETPPGEPVRNMIVNSSCGLCGRQGIDALLSELVPLAVEGSFPLDVLYEVPERIRASQSLFAQTGGCHAAALFDGHGRVLSVHEDLGRHNALDKVLGESLLEGRELGTLGVFLSGRASLEMVIKAARGRLGLVAAVSAPSQAAVEAADRLGITLCGFMRGDEVVIYAHGARVSS